MDTKHASTQKETGDKAASLKSVVATYWSHTKKYPRLVVLTILGLFLVQGSALVSPLFLREFFDLLTTQAPHAAAVQQLVTTLVFLGATYLVNWSAYRVDGWSTMILQARVMRDLLDDAFGYLLRHSYGFFVSRFTGSLTHRTSKFSRAYETLFDTAIRSFIPTALFVLGVIIVLATRSLMLAGILAAWVVVFVAFQIWVSLLRQPLRTARSAADTKVTAALADAIGNQSTIQQFTGEEHELRLFKRVSEQWRAATIRSWFADEYIWMAVGLFMTAVELVLLYGAIILWSRGTISVGDIVLVQAYLITVFARLAGINRELRRFYDGFADAAEMVALLQAPHEIKDKRGAKHLAIDRAEVWFDDVSFGFHDNAAVLHQFNLTIKGGERVALVGPSGAGKSTVTKLLLRLYDVERGEIKIDKQNIVDVTQDSLRDAISFVPQEPILFHRTLMENIRYGWRDATDEEVIEAAKKARCHEFISKLPLGYHTYVGERGIKLSGGERQRVAIARAILKDAPILILDEATSSLDSESEAHIQDALETLMQGKTVVVIAHRLSTIMKMNRIVVMEEGKIVAQGSHLQLIKERGLYQKLWNIQAGGFIGLTDKTTVQSIGVGLVDEKMEEHQAGPQTPERAVKRKRARRKKPEATLAKTRKNG